MSFGSNRYSFYSFSRLQRRFPPLSREAVSELKIDSRIVLSAEVFLNLGGTTDMYVRPGRLAQAFFVCVELIFIFRRNL